MQFALSWARRVRRVIMVNNSAEDALMKVNDKQQGHCPDCDQNVAGHTYPQDQTSTLYGDNTYEFDQMQADHIKPWSKGGKTELSNCQMLCKWHNEHKSDN